MAGLTIHRKVGETFWVNQTAITVQSTRRGGVTVVCVGPDPVRRTSPVAAERKPDPGEECSNMSRRRFTFTSPIDGEDYEVVAGWDRPLGRMHLTISRFHRGQDGDDAVIWDCLRVPDPSIVSLTPGTILAIVGGFTDCVPEDWKRAVVDDYTRHPGNETTTHRYSAV